MKEGRSFILYLSRSLVRALFHSFICNVSLYAILFYAFVSMCFVRFVCFVCLFNFCIFLYRYFIHCVSVYGHCACIVQQQEGAAKNKLTKATSRRI